MPYAGLRFIPRIIFECRIIGERSVRLGWEGLAMSNDAVRKREAAFDGVSVPGIPALSTPTPVPDSPASSAADTSASIGSVASSTDLLDDATLSSALVVDKGSSVPLWIQLRDQIVGLISEKRLPYGMKMPTVRNLAKDLGVSVSVVNQAYRFLKVTGYLVARQGSGVKVRQRVDHVKDEDFPAISQALEEFVGKCRSFNMTNLDIMDTIRFHLGYQEYVEAEGRPQRTGFDALFRNDSDAPDDAEPER